MLVGMASKSPMAIGTEQVYALVDMLGEDATFELPARRPQRRRLG
jgi:hypothetical protein